jgi:hypothetical protein
VHCPQDSPSPTGPFETADELTSWPTRCEKSKPTSESISACVRAWSIHSRHDLPPFSVLLSCLARIALKASTSSLAHLTQALIMAGGKQLWKQLTVLRMIMKYTSESSQM